MAPSGTAPSLKSGFTLIEISLVLVIIGLIIGGILTGRDLLNTAAIRSQISQIEKYNTAVGTFQNKYGGLPGDLMEPNATNFGFQPRGWMLGEGDGNNILEGNCDNITGGNTGTQQGCGELAVFWQDLSKAGLIDTNVPTGTNYPNVSAGNTLPGTHVTMSTTPSISGWLPVAKLGQGNFVYVYSVNSTNYFAVQLVQVIGWDVESTGNSGAGANAMTVQQAYNIDKKIDDGLPQSGNITACDDDWDIVGGAAVWAAGKGFQGAGGTAQPWNNCIPTTAATPYLNTNCFDNNNVAGTQTYSTAKNATALNCALSFQFQQ